MPDSEMPSGMEEICRQVLTKTLRLKRGENVVIESWTHTLPWANTMVLEARRLGIRATLIYEDDATYWRAVAECKPADVGRMPAPELGAIAKTQGYVFFWGPEDRPKLRALPSEQYGALTSYNSAWYEAAEKAHLRGCRMELAQATAPAAQFYGVNPAVWQNTLIEASRVDFGKMAREGAKIAARLRAGRMLRLTHANGTSIELKLARRKPTVDDGVVDAADVKSGNNMTTFPGGAVYVALDEGFASGTVVANRTSYPTKGALTGGHWSFSENHLTEFSYSTGGERFQEAFEAAPAGKDRPGFLSIGLNPKIQGAPGIEDFERGTVLLGVGANAAFGGKTKIPFQSWLAVAGGHLEVDGKPLVADEEIL